MAPPAQQIKRTYLSFERVVKIHCQKKSAIRMMTFSFDSARIIKCDPVSEADEGFTAGELNITYSDSVLIIDMFCGPNRRVFDFKGAVKTQRKSLACGYELSGPHGCFQGVCYIRLTETRNIIGYSVMIPYDARGPSSSFFHRELSPSGCHDGYSDDGFAFGEIEKCKQRMLNILHNAGLSGMREVSGGGSPLPPLSSSSSTTPGGVMMMGGGGGHNNNEAGIAGAVGGLVGAVGGLVGEQQQQQHGGARPPRGGRKGEDKSVVSCAMKRGDTAAAGAASSSSVAVKGSRHRGSSSSATTHSVSFVNNHQGHNNNDDDDDDGGAGSVGGGGAGKGTAGGYGGPGSSAGSAASSDIQAVVRVGGGGGSGGRRSHHGSGKGRGVCDPAAPPSSSATVSSSSSSSSVGTGISAHVPSIVLQAHVGIPAIEVTPPPLRRLELMSSALLEAYRDSDENEEEDEDEEDEDEPTEPTDLSKTLRENGSGRIRDLFQQLERSLDDGKVPVTTMGLPPSSHLLTVPPPVRPTTPGYHNMPASVAGPSSHQRHRAICGGAAEPAHRQQCSPRGRPPQQQSLYSQQQPQQQHQQKKYSSSAPPPPLSPQPPPQGQGPVEPQQQPAPAGPPSTATTSKIPKILDELIREHTETHESGGGSKAATTTTIVSGFCYENGSLVRGIPSVALTPIPKPLLSSIVGGASSSSSPRPSQQQQQQQQEPAPAAPLVASESGLVAYKPPADSMDLYYKTLFENKKSPKPRSHTNSNVSGGEQQHHGSDRGEGSGAGTRDVDKEGTETVCGGGKKREKERDRRRARDRKQGGNGGVGGPVPSFAPSYAAAAGIQRDDVKPGPSSAVKILSGHGGNATVSSSSSSSSSSKRRSTASIRPSGAGGGPSKVKQPRLQGPPASAGGPDANVCVIIGTDGIVKKEQPQGNGNNGVQKQMLIIDPGACGMGPGVVNDVHGRDAATETARDETNDAVSAIVPSSQTVTEESMMTAGGQQ
ncbi:nuclear protein ORF-M [Proboscivirus elephantidbeta4]|uniref:Nuclear protein ORF-M n=1 Tax=Elephant endotheliotropic herpesvirus 4 TaxID=548914 RepID=A0A0S1TPU5_9BETA|nr:nuclear protein ORF-M [Elephant endotheliotropic herpesvirus 4]ALM26026.1 nuclear protein ORF-M [Elephant endotheliotropic herpesvirus 4]